MHARGLKTQSLGLPFLFLRMLASPARVESHPWLGNPGWEVTLQWQWPLGPCAQGGLPHSQEHPGNLHTTVPSCFSAGESLQA